MSRSGYSDSLDNWDLIRWRGAVASATKGRRGQRLLHDMLAAMDALPQKRLIKGDLVSNGEVCAIGSLALAKNVDVSGLDVEDHQAVAERFGIAHALACEIMFENDQDWALAPETPEERWTRMRAWVKAQLRESPAATEAKS